MIIGIAGGTCSGKTTIVHVLDPKIKAKAISLDNYFKDSKTFPTVLGHPDYDRIDAVDWEELVKDINETIGNIVLEGFLVLASERIRQKLDVSFFIDMDEDILIARRLTREPDTPEGYINKIVRERHKSLVLPTMQYADVVLDGNKNTNVLSKEIQQHVNPFHTTL